MQGVSILFEIGKALKEARETSGVSIKEASEDLGIRDVILENIEEGAMGSFKNIYDLKDYITNYAKYLGLDADSLVDDFNEYMFEYTSKIPVKEIEKKMQEMNKEKTEPEISSPYSKPMRKYPTKYYVVTYVFLILMVVLIIVWSVSQISEAKGIGVIESKGVVNELR